MKVEVTDIGPEMSGSRNADKRVEICAVEVDLTTCVVHRSTNVPDGFFEDPVG
ncbi:unannotated protein [freshwater metagenome]|uniref:Unannotated protein n=1 Tax=freshwater metagenome TaxID=449393 RepID=A0A6J7HCT3_9ZZZZ